MTIFITEESKFLLDSVSLGDETRHYIEELLWERGKKRQ